VTTTERREFWEQRYRAADHRKVSWFEPTPALSLQMLDLAGVTVADSVVDVGGGASTLAEVLWGRGHRDLTVVDASPSAMDIARGRWPAGDQVEWIDADLLGWHPDRRWDVWHDRAVFHFLIHEAQRAAYRTLLRRAVAPGGVVAVAGFAEDGPTSCSGLDVRRHTTEELLAALDGGADDLEEVAVGRHEHLTPSGATQTFSWVVARRSAAA
jgi:SAM-dependent methyltransferase